MKDANIVEVINDGYIVIARDSNGEIYTWGYNGYGQLGNGTTENSSNPICISEIEGSVLKDANIVEVINSGGTTIARDSNGNLYTWGNNYYKRLGYFTNGSFYSSEPICINKIIRKLENVNIVEVIDVYRTIIARDSEGKIYAWGYDRCGQLGDETESDTYNPVCISDMIRNELYGQNVEKIGIMGFGGYFIYYITESGQVFNLIYSPPDE